MDEKLYLRDGSAGDGAFTLAVTPERAGWAYAGLRVLTLPPGAAHTWATGDDELLVLPLAGSAVVTCDGETFELQGRRDVFSRVSDFCYAPRGATVTVTSAGGGVFALPSARCRRHLPPRYGAAADVPVELRGAGQSSRQVNNFCSPEAFECDKLIAVEVLTPGGNWSSYPPHKHDEAREVTTGDVVLIPHGWHGPSIAAPGYDLYYLNVMAGPAHERAWLFCDDPAHAWVRDSWRDQPVDPRLPMASAAGKEGTA
jgi:5-deoxy-glucuronate isomerase